MIKHILKKMICINLAKVPKMILGHVLKHMLKNKHGHTKTHLKKTLQFCLVLPEFLNASVYSWCKGKKIWQKRFFLKLSSDFAKYIFEARIVTVLDKDAFDLEKLRNTVNLCERPARCSTNHKRMRLQSLILREIWRGRNYKDNVEKSS